MNTHGVVLFYTTSAAMRAEKVLLKAALAVKLIPTPRQFSSDCGIALRFEWSRSTDVRLLLEEARVEATDIRELKP